MGKTADLTVVQKNIIDNPSPRRVKSIKHSIAKELAVHRVLVSKHVNRKLSVRKKCGRKRAQPTERTAALWGLSSKIDSRIWVNFTRNGLKLGSRHQEPPHTDVSKNLATVVVRGILPGLRREELDCCPVVQSTLSDESKFCISFGNQGPRVWRKGGEAHSPSCLKSSDKFPQSVMIWGAMSSAGVGPLCFLKTTSLHPVTKKMFEALHASFCWPAF